MSKTLKQLEKAELKASCAYSDLRNERDGKRRQLISEATAAIDAALEAEYGERLKSLAEAERAALAVLQAAKIAAASSSAPWPIGTELCGWARPRLYGYGYGKDKPLQMVARGILEVVTRDTIHPNNIASYSRAPIGEYIVRILKKDGTPGLAYERLHRGRSKWLPVGEKPKEKGT